MEEGELEVLDGVITLGQGLFNNVLAVDGGLAVGRAETADPDDGGSLRDLELGSDLGGGGALGELDGSHSRLVAALADHVQELHLNVHASPDVQNVAVDDGAHAVAAGDEALPFQRCQDIPQLGTADPQGFRQDAFPGQALAGGEFAVLHGGQQLGADGLRLSRLTAHVIHLIKHKIGTTH